MANHDEDNKRDREVTDMYEDDDDLVIADTSDEELNDLKWPKMPQPPRTLADLRAPIDWDISPQCTYCAWYEPGDGRFCAAFPTSRRKPIPDTIYTGRQYHFDPIGTELIDDLTGQPMVFEPYVDPWKGTVRTPDNKALLEAYAEHQRQQKQQAGSPHKTPDEKEDESE